ncbi:hypothetical protein BAUCODRAFT_79502 [Baudoinia panamericana UAMH 10762]|uniref:Lariat debranching enzyme C-terminal domain-containing protein n=1 Tax=Baudoinia panamericana (strain UAMH 10762) TaxID=717646 RepID=M2MYZ8_BAUPA|nr:uncharacterized protein BAUCODRAFT_79502 [Baudoinia panamericana UAMH 10762]EMC91530.1 hypothetical protein BAUCODRAFT_79502 [Baudoinia panamericana UAMH 10762]
MASAELSEENDIRLAIEGCGHGTLHAIYASVAEACNVKGWPSVDLLVIGGDFQSVRNAYDLNCVSMPAKYRSMCDFHEYYSGSRTAPYLTVFVGGNHEASNYLFELYHGGWVAPNIYYLGAANVLRLGSLRIAGMSGIWKGYNYRKPHLERLPYNESDLRSIYHTRELDVRKLLQIRTQVDVGISHDWPKGVEWKGNWKQLFRFKKHLQDDATTGQLGSVAAQQVMNWLRPMYWFSAHLHCKYAAVVEYDEHDTEAQQPHTAETIGLPPTGNADEIDLELEDDVNGVAPVAPGQGLDGLQVPVASDAPISGPISSANEARAALPAAFNKPASIASHAVVPIEHPPKISNRRTNFLALDKCLPNRHFLQLTAIPNHLDSSITRPLKLAYDREWLAITRAFALTEPPVFGDPDSTVPRSKSQAEYKNLIDEQMQWVEEHLTEVDMIIPESFEATAPIYDGGDWTLAQYSHVAEYPNPQTAKYCDLLKIPNALELSEEQRSARMAAGPRPDTEAKSFRGESSGRGRGRGGFGRGHGHGGAGRGRGRGGFRAR